MKPVRTFVAVELTPEIRGRAHQLISVLRRVVADVRWSPPENMHLTLKFLGDIEVLEIPRICQAVSQAVADLSPFGIEVQGAGAFPDAERPRTVWLGVGEGTDALTEVHERLEAALAPLGFREEGRRFRPHLTLGRVRDSEAGSRFAQTLAEHAEFFAGEMIVGEVTIFSSELSRSGSKYEVLGHADFGGE
ncbi:MAG: RNA 2',3'-cyclic phosphodiesterase [Planctomycetia bacterium]|nr:RNA 2',3'-cyclic phosphodiesterase [Planctomycetia bacterium]